MVVQLDIVASESLINVTDYCLLIRDRILEYVPFNREVRKPVINIFLN